MTHTTRRHPRTLEQAFGPNPWPISGPYRRGGASLGRLAFRAAAFMGAATLLGLVAGMLAGRAA